jgi:hypothetical protein
MNMTEHYLIFTGLFNLVLVLSAEPVANSQMVEFAFLSGHWSISVKLQGQVLCRKLSIFSLLFYFNKS